MTRIVFLISLLITLGLNVDGQINSTEKEVVTFLAKLRQAIKQNDINFLETALADEYIWSGPQGTTENKTQNLAYFAKERATPSYKILSNELENEQIRTYGDLAIVTGDFRFVSSFTNAHPGDPPHKDAGRYTGVFQKRNGRWQVLLEHDSEKPHDKAEMEPLVAALGRAYTDMIRRADAASISKILADDYIVTDEVGIRLTKEQDLATYKDRASALKFDTVEYKDQKVRMITGSVAVDHSTIRFTGTGNGKPFDITERITTTWAFRDGRWLIVADHFSYVK